MTKTLSQKEVKEMFQRKTNAISKVEKVIKDLQKENVEPLAIVDILLKYASDLGKESRGSEEKAKEALIKGFSDHLNGRVIYKE